MKNRLFLSGLLAAALAPSLWAQNEIGFIEKFALAKDRDAVLEELVPGTEQSYFFQALQAQNTRSAAKLKGIMEQWAKRFPDSAQRKIIENREALLSYDTTPQATLAFLRDRLHLEFDHERETRDEKPDLPTALDPKLIARGVFAQKAMEDSDDLGHCNSGALERFVVEKTPLKPAQRRALLSKVKRPDLPGLVDLVAMDLATPESGGFGEFEIHRALLPEQLDELAARMPALFDSEKFIYTRLRKLAPSEDTDLEFDSAERAAWLDRLWAYARKLSPAFNSLKAQILYQRLLLDRTRGVYDRARFLQYLQLPRHADYVRPEYLARGGNGERLADFSADLSEPMRGTKPIGNDVWLVREYFLQLFKTEASWEPWAVYVRDNYVKALFAEAKVTNGGGDMEKSAALLTPSAFQALKDRVDLDFSPANSQFSPPGEDVTISVAVKNVPKLIVKIYEINTLSFYLTQKRQLNTDVSLDGLVANYERTVEFNDPPLRRVERKFDFPELKGRRGAWLIEFVGGGKSSRALIRKGAWSLVQQTGAAGDMITVLDEKHAPVPNAAAWQEGRKYSADEKTGRIYIPFTQQAGTAPIVLSDTDGEFATLTNFEHHAEEYKLDAQFHIDREQLLARQEATLAMRAELLLDGMPVPSSLLLEPRLSITSTTLDGITTTREIKDLKLDPAKVLTQTFAVPDRLASLNVTFFAKVENMSLGGEKKELSASHDWPVNGIDRTEAVSDGHFSHFDKRFVFECLGKNGEPVPDQPVNFKFTHSDFDVEIEADLRTDEYGRIDLGELPDIEKVVGSMPNGRDAWCSFGESANYPKTIHALAGEKIQVPWLGDAPPARGEVSLLELRSDLPVRSRLDALKFANGFLEIDGLTPGDYRMMLRGEDGETLIRVTAGAAVSGWIVGSNRSLEERNPPPLHIQSITVQPDAIVVQLGNVNPFARVHVAATRFLPDGDFFDQLGGFSRSEPGTDTAAREPNVFVSGRLVGDEYRYILERRYASKYPGNMLSRPGLLLDPWEVRSTETTAQGMSSGERPAPGAAGRQRMLKEPESKSTDDKSVVTAEENGPNFDFLASSSRVFYNLIPDAQGVVRIDRKLLGDRQDVQVYAEDLASAELKEIALPEQGSKFHDLRLPRSLDPQKHYTEKKQASALVAGQALAIPDIQTAELQSYDSLSSIYALLTALNSDANLVKFAWILQWPAMKEDEKRAKYSEFACHELNFFVSRKDPEFFQKVVQPYLKNKKDKTFLDEWLLGADLHRYLQPWAYEQLNVVERALLAQRIPGEADAAKRYLRELWELLPPDPARQDKLFQTALYGHTMEGAVELQTAIVENSGGVIAGAGEVGKVNLPKEPNGPTSVARDDFAVESYNRTRAENVFEVEKRWNHPVRAYDVAPALRGASVPAPPGLDSAFTDSSTAGAATQRFWSDSGSVGGGASGVRVESQYIARGLVFENSSEFLERRREMRQFYRRLGPVKEWAENNYCQLPISQQNGSLIPANAFWRDYAAWDGKSPFLSPQVAEASRNFSEIMFALSVLDLPFDAPKSAVKSADGRFLLTAVGPLIVFHKEIEPAAAPGPAGSELLVSENFFRQDDRTESEGNEKFDKYVTGEFLAGVAYGAKVVVTNPTSTPQKLEILMQIPQGALPILGSKATGSKLAQIDAYSTQTFEYYFYFPAPAPNPEPHYPVHVSREEAFAGSAKATELRVVKQLTDVDKTSWDYVSQDGTEDDVFAYLEKENIQRVDLERIAWRAQKSKAFFQKLIGVLAKRHVYNDVIYSYAVVHNDALALGEWLRHRDDFLAECGLYLAAKLITIDPVERRAYEQLEYSPLINQRAHRLGAENSIPNSVLRGQYQALLRILAHKPALDSADEMSVVYYLFLQDRVEEALARLATIKPETLPTRLQYDYLRCYADFYEEKLPEARGLAAQYAAYPVDRWRKLFADVTAQLDEIQGQAPMPSPAPATPDAKPDREAQQGALAASEPSFDFKVENRSIALSWKNLPEVTINYYLMDPEFLFSSSPFVSEDPGRFSIVKPAKTTNQKLPDNLKTLEVPLPAEFARSNVLIEILGAGQRKAQAYHANTLRLNLAENYGRLELRDEGAGKPIAKVYVKVYARLRGGQIRFFKDGYTDLRGKFDYASLNAGEGESIRPTPQTTDSSASGGPNYQMLRPTELGAVEKLAILILSDNNGDLVREVNPPAE